MPKSSTGPKQGKRCDTFNEDVIKLVTPGGEESHAVVIRCWADEQSPEAAAEAQRLGIAFTPLAPGKLEVMHPSGLRTEIDETEIIQTVDRGFIFGDIVRAAGGRGQAGFITKISPEVRLERALSGEKIEGWHAVGTDVVGANAVSRGDHVTSLNWIGIVEEIVDMGEIELADGTTKWMVDATGGLTIGRTAKAYAHDQMDGLSQPVFPDGFERIVDVFEAGVAVNWLCTNQLHPPSGRGAYIRPPRFWSDLDQLTVLKAGGDSLHTIGDKMLFKDKDKYAPSPELLASAGTSSDPHRHRVMVVTECRTTVEVVWQDGTRTTQPAQSLEICHDPDDDIDVWPGDVGLFTGPGEAPRPAVVDSMNARKRTTKLRLLPPGASKVDISTPPELVSSLEFDPHGPPPDSFGLRRGDAVLVASRVTGHAVPTVAKLGESEVISGLFPPSQEIRLQMMMMGSIQSGQWLANRAKRPRRTPEALDLVDWFGTVVDLLVTGEVRVKFPSGRTADFELPMLYHLDDGLDDAPPPGEEGMEYDDEEVVWEDEEGNQVEMDNEEWEDDDAQEDEGWAEDQAPNGPGAPPVTDITLDDDSDMEILATPPREPDSDIEIIEPAPVSMPKEEEDHPNWTRFLMLEEAPQDHHYFNQQVTAPPKAYTARVHKEHAVLASSLPPNILVRVYEDRIDLMRCLIIGPLGTPFANAPFLFDVYLPPSKFPQEPPQVFFHSWGGGTRVSPNLYVEGKVCLSLLGTWAGDVVESWSGARSSILQVFVSIQALIMTEQPYFTEPGFEKQIGTVEGERASDLYDERTFTLSRAFVKRACEFPPTNFADEIKAYFIDGLPSTGPGALKPIVKQAKALLAESDEYWKEVDAGKAEEVEENGEAEGEGEDVREKERPRSALVPPLRVLTEGAALSLRRTVAGLEAIAKSREEGEKA